MASTSGRDVQGMRGNLTRNYALGGNIDASSSAGWDSNQGFAPVGNATSAFSGNFDGLGHEISGLTMVRTAQLGGLFGEVGTAGVVRNVKLGPRSTCKMSLTAVLAPACWRDCNRGLIDNVNSQGAMTPATASWEAAWSGGNMAPSITASSGTYKVIAGSGYGGGGLAWSGMQLDAVVQEQFEQHDGQRHQWETGAGRDGHGAGRHGRAGATGASPTVLPPARSVATLQSVAWSAITGIKSTITGSFATGAVLGSGSAWAVWWAITPAPSATAMPPAMLVSIIARAASSAAWWGPTD